MNNELAVREFLNEMWNDKEYSNHKLDDIHNIFTGASVIESPLGNKIGKDSIKNTNLVWLKSFPNITVTDIQSERVGNVVITDWMSTATHEEIFNGIEITGKTVNYPGKTIFCFGNDDKVVRYFCFIDLILIYSQLGYHLMQPKYDKQQLLYKNKILLMETLSKLPKSGKQLSHREIQCLCFFVNGYTAKKIAVLQDLSYRTIETHLKNAMDKLDCFNKIQLIDLIRKEYLSPLFHDLFDILIREINHVS